MGNYINREQRRKLGITKEQADQYERQKEFQKMIEETTDDMLIDAGSKVKIKCEQIMGRKDYPRMRSDYKQFIETNKETEFTVLIDEKIHNKYKMVSLKEDTKDPRWLFWVGDLVPVDA